MGYFCPKIRNSKETDSYLKKIKHVEKWKSEMIFGGKIQRKIMNIGEI